MAAVEEKAASRWPKPIYLSPVVHPRALVTPSHSWMSRERAESPPCGRSCPALDRGPSGWLGAGRILESNFDHKAVKKLCSRIKDEMVSVFSKEGHTAADGHSAKKKEGRAHRSLCFSHPST